MQPALIGLFVLLIITASCRQAYKEHTEILDLSGTWKFIRYEDHPDFVELYNLKEDVNEVHNLA